MREIHTDSVQPVALAEPDIATLQARLAREKRARAAAEALIESKSRELFDANNELAQMLSGSVKILADVLAMAKPEVFQKAGKVQRWARKVTPDLGIDRPWELDLAALLYPLGIISLPEEVTTKYALDMELSDEERALVEESPGSAMQLLENMPRMGGVARAIYYSRKGFDGSGFPADDMRGADIPEAARVLHVLIDLADRATGVGKTRAEAFAQMAAQKQVYDVEILKICYAHLNKKPEEETGGRHLLRLAPSLLQPGDIVHSDIVDKEGHLMLAAGSELSEIGIKRLHTRYIQKGMVEKVSVTRVPEDAPEPSDD